MKHCDNNGVLNELVNETYYSLFHDLEWLLSSSSIFWVQAFYYICRVTVLCSISMPWKHWSDADQSHFHIYLGSWFELNLLNCSTEKKICRQVSAQLVFNICDTFLFSFIVFSANIKYVGGCLRTLGTFSPLFSRTESHVNVNSVFANDLRIS